MKRVIIVIFLGVTFLIVGILLGWKFSNNIDNIPNKQEKNVTTNQNKEEQEVDINSRLVQDLYNQVSSKNAYDGEKDFYVSEASETMKLGILASNLNENKMELLDCDNNNIPNVKDEVYYRICYINKISGYDMSSPQYQYQYAYPKNYIEAVYKKIYGDDSQLDTNTKIPYGDYGVKPLYYNSDLDKYVQYTVDGFGATGCGGYTGTLNKAIKYDKELKIYEKVENLICEERNNPNDPNEITIPERKEYLTYVYTFKLDKDGMYTFVSRVKEK